MKSISAIIAVILIVAVTVAISVGIALWLLGVERSAGFGTRPVRLQLFGDMKVRGNEFHVIVKNTGSDTLYIDRIIVDDKYTAIILDAREWETWESRVDEVGGARMVYAEPGEVVEIWGIVEKELKPGMVHSIRIHTTMGVDFYRLVRSSYNPLVTGLYALDTGLKNPARPGEKIVLMGFTFKNNYHRPVLIDRVEVYSIDNLDTPLYTVDRWINGTPLRLIVPPSATVNTTGLDEMIRANLPPGKYILKAHMVIQGLDREDYVAGFARVSGETIKAYVIYITVDDEDPDNVIEEPYPGWQGDVSVIINYLRQYFDVVVINRMSEYIELFENPPNETTIIINAHNEPIPVPKRILDKYNHGDIAEAARNAAHEWYSVYVKRLIERGAIFVENYGYPCWGMANKRYARTYSSWTDSWGRTINRLSGLDEYTGGARATGVTYDGARWATGWPYDKTYTWRHTAVAEPIIGEIERILGVALPDSYQGWDTMDTTGIPADKKIIFYRSSSNGKPIAWAIKTADPGCRGWFLELSFSRYHGNTTDVAITTAVLSVYMYLVTVAASNPYT